MRNDGRQHRNFNAKRHRERLLGVGWDRLSEPPKPLYNGAGEAEVVPGYQLASALQRWTLDYLQGRTANQSRNNWLDEIPQYGPQNYLADQTGIHIRRVGAICNGEFQTVPLSQADALLQAIERPDLLDTEIQVVPNPNWSFEKWVDYMAERGCI